MQFKDLSCNRQQEVCGNMSESPCSGDSDGFLYLLAVLFSERNVLLYLHGALWPSDSALGS